MEENNPLKMKVTELKSELGKRGLSQTGLKFDLAQRLQSAMDVEEFGALPAVSSLSSSPPCLAPLTECTPDKAAPNTSAAPDQGLTPTATVEQESKHDTSPRHCSKHDIDTDPSMLVEAPPEASEVDAAREVSATSPQAGRQSTSDVTEEGVGNQALPQSSMTRCMEPNNARGGECGTEENQHIDNSCATAVEADAILGNIEDTAPSKQAYSYPQNAEGDITEQHARCGVEKQIALKPGEEDIGPNAKELRDKSELTREYSDGADTNIPVDSETSMAADILMDESSLIYNEIDRMKDREQRFSPAHVADDSGDGEVARGRDVVDRDSSSGILDMSDPIDASRSAVPRMPCGDTKTKLMKRKARFATPHPTHCVHEAAGVERSDATRQELSKMARRAERFGVSGECNVPSAMPGTSAPGLVSGSNTTGPSKAEIRTRNPTGAGDCSAFESLSQRSKPSQAQASSCETDGTSPHRKHRGGDGQGGATAVISITASSKCMVTPQENSNASSRDSNRPTLEAEKLRRRKVRFLPAAASQAGDVELPHGDSTLSPPMCFPTESTCSLPGSVVSSRSFEKFGVMSGPLLTKRSTLLSPSACSSDAERKAAEQADKMRERRKRFAGDSRRVINNSSC